MAHERPMSGGRQHQHRLAHGSREFARRLWEKCQEDEVFFMAGAIAFGVLLALVPLLTLGIGLTGIVLRSRSGDPTAAVVGLVAENLPRVGDDVDLTGLLQSITADVVDQSAAFTLAGSIVFVWLATRLAGSLRVALREVFDIDGKHGIFVAKVSDVLAVLIGVVLITLNMGITFLLTWAVELGVDVFGWGGSTLSLAERGLGYAVALTSIWTFFLIAYRYLPPRSVPWRTAFIAATFASLAHEALKLSFSWYVTEVANYTSTLGNLATVAVLFFWIYYGSLVFILGGEVAQVYTMRKASPAGTVTFESVT